MSRLHLIVNTVLLALCNDVCVGLFEVELENCSSRYPVNHFMVHLDVGELYLSALFL